MKLSKEAKKVLDYYGDVYRVVEAYCERRCALLGEFLQDDLLTCEYDQAIEALRTEFCVREIECMVLGARFEEPGAEDPEFWPGS